MSETTLARAVAHRLAVFGFFVLLAIVHTWPLARRPAVYSRVDNGDYCLNAWAMDWVARTLPTDPAHLFDANIFFPAPLALAYSEPLILQGALAIPSVWAGAPPVATFNLVLIAGLALTGWAFALLARHATGSWLAGLVAGSAIAFNAHHLVRLVHIQALHLELVPLVFLALERLLVTGSVRHAALLGASVSLQAVQSVYLLVFTAWATLFAALARWPEWRGRLRTAAGWTVVAAATSALLLLPLLWPYAQLASSHGLVRSIDDAQRCSATWTDYLYTGARIHYEAWSHRFVSSDANFPGLTVTALAISALWAAGAHLPRIRMWLAVVFGSVLLSVLPRLNGFAWLHEHVPVLAAIRCYSRAGQMALVGMGMLAGFGAARLLGRMRSPRRATVAAVTLIAAVNVEALRAPLGYDTFSGVPAIYERLRQEPRAVVVEMPFYNRRTFAGNAIYMLNATRHRHPIVNGYSGFTPPDFENTARAMQTFPEYPALEMMHRLGVTHVVVHRTPGMEEHREAINASPALRLIAEEGRIAIYRFVSR